MKVFLICCFWWTTTCCTKGDMFVWPSTKTRFFSKLQQFEVHQAVWDSSVKFRYGSVEVHSACVPLRNQGSPKKDLIAFHEILFIIHNPHMYPIYPKKPICFHRSRGIQQDDTSEDTLKRWMGYLRKKEAAESLCGEHTAIFLVLLMGI